MSWVGLGGGFTLFWHVRLATNVLNKINAIEYLVGTAAVGLFQI
jgi:hypothetical protein